MCMCMCMHVHVHVHVHVVDLVRLSQNYPLTSQSLSHRHYLQAHTDLPPHRIAQVHSRVKSLVKPAHITHVVLVLRHLPS